MSKHWNPDEELARVETKAAKSWPEGATAGLLLVAVACLGMAVVLYQVAGPRNVFEEDTVSK
jgi:hypothetical protein